MREITNKIELDANKLNALERTNGDMKKKVGTLESTITSMKKSKEQLVELMRAQVAEKIQINRKINIL